MPTTIGDTAQQQNREGLSFLKDQEGATAVEYGLITALVAVVIIVALIFFGNILRNILGW